MELKIFMEAGFCVEVECRVDLEFCVEPEFVWSLSFV